MPGAGLIVSKPEFCLSGLEGILDRPALPFHSHQRGDRCAGRAPGREEGEVPISKAAADQEPPRPHPWEAVVVLIRFQIGEFAVSPVIEPLTLCTSACREAL